MNATSLWVRAVRSVKVEFTSVSIFTHMSTIDVGSTYNFVNLLHTHRIEVARALPILSAQCLTIQFWDIWVNILPMHTRHMQEGTLRKNVLYCTRIFHTYIVWCRLTHLHGCWIHLWHICISVRKFYDTILQMSEYFLMRNYELVRCHTLIIYGIIDGGYVEMENLSYLSIFLLLYI